jgi:hypothetical protein
MGVIIYVRLSGALIKSQTMKTKNEAEGKKCAVCNHVHTKPDGTFNCGCEIGKKDVASA